MSMSMVFSCISLYFLLRTVISAHTSITPIRMVKDLPDILSRFCTKPTVITQAFKEILDFYIDSETPESIEHEVAHVSPEFLNLLLDDLVKGSFTETYRGLQIIPASGWLPYSGEFDIHVVLMRKSDLGHPALQKMIPTFNS